MANKAKKCKDFIPCTECGENWLDHPSAMFHDHIWKAMGMKPHDLLCDVCATAKTLRDCPWNNMVAARYLMEHR